MLPLMKVIFRGLAVLVYSVNLETKNRRMRTQNKDVWKLND